MADFVSVESLSRNQDLFRGSAVDLDPIGATRALQWLRDGAPYPYPGSIHYNLTLRCTARCAHCYQWAWPSQDELTIGQLEELMGVFQSWGVRTITFGGGNPLLYEHFPTALELAHRAGIEIGIISEGIGMSAEWADAICKYAGWIRFSLDGPSSEIHDRIRSAPGLFQKVISDVALLKLGKSTVRIGLNCVVQKQNRTFLTQMIDLAEGIGVTTLLFKLSHGNDPGGRFLLNSDEWSDFVQWVRENAGRKLRMGTNLPELEKMIGHIFHTNDVVDGQPVRTFYKRNAVRCFVPLLFLTCDSRGNAYPCDYLQADTRPWSKYASMRDEFCLGNILSNPDLVLEKLAGLMRARVHGLPASGYSECGCCTRFCQLNASLTAMENQLASASVTTEAVRDCLRQAGAGAGETGPVFL